MVLFIICVFLRFPWLKRQHELLRGKTKKALITPTKDPSGQLIYYRGCFTNMITKVYYWLFDKKEYVWFFKGKCIVILFNTLFLDIISFLLKTIINYLSYLQYGNFCNLVHGLRWIQRSCKVGENMFFYSLIILHFFLTSGNK